MPSKGEQTRQLILSTAKQLFSQKGYAVVTMKDICDEIGLSRGGLYRHYKLHTGDDACHPDSG